MTTKPVIPTAPSVPTDGWERSQKETIPELYRECREKAQGLETMSAALREKMQMLERVASAMGFQVERQPTKPESVPAATVVDDHAS